MGGTPKSSKSLESLDQFTIETHGDLGIHHDKLSLWIQTNPNKVQAASQSIPQRHS